MWWLMELGMRLWKLLCELLMSMFVVLLLKVLWMVVLVLVVI